MPKINNIHRKIREVAKDAFIDANDEFCSQTEKELEKIITPEFLEKVRTEIIKKAKQTAQNQTQK